ncbi:MAG: efflux RND transporter permease subunit [Candidatus Marinimicrobia bacterium]|nr:efflux RND transporter permease subunit [Candidatus Neomarinimicrobiota bacterium]MDD5709272.1 efflux RND transporter permease subunit [Candidatus Neomarinimicrobiota bacterium]
MKISSLSIRRPVTFFMIYLIAVGFGLFGLSRLKLDLYPEIEFPMAIVMTNYEGVGPEDIENTLTRTLESTITSVEGVKHISSISRNSISVVQIEFNWGTDMNQAETDIRRRIDRVRRFLPEDASDPLTFVFDPSMQAIMRLKASSEQMGSAELRKLVEDQVQPRLERIEGVASASVYGGLERQIQVNINPYELAASNISILEVISLLATANLPIPGGLIEEGLREFSVVTNSEFESIEDIKNTIVGYSASGDPLFLKNIANVVDGYKDVTSVVRDNRENSINIGIQKQSDANTVQVCNATRKALGDIEKNIGGDIRLYVHFDQSEFIEESAGNLASTAIIAFLLTGLVLFIFLRHFRSSLIAAVSVPVSIVVTFFFMSILNVTLNIISMAGLAIAIGMLVDNSIVVLENIFRRHDDLNENICIAANKGASEVGTAVTASTLTTLSIFIPMLFVGGVAGMMIKDLAMTIIVSLTISLLVSLTLVPLLSSKLLNKNAEDHKTRIMAGFDNAMERFFNVLGRLYRKTLDWSLKHRKTLVFSILALFGLSVFLLSRIGFEFMPKTDDNQFSLSIELPVGTALPTTDAYFRQIEEIIVNSVPEIENMNVNFGARGGFGAISGAATNTGRVSVTLVDKELRKRSKFEIQNEVRKKISGIPGLKIAFASGGFMGSGNDLVIEIYGHDLKQAEAIANAINDKISGIPGMVDIQLSFSDPQPEYTVVVDREKAGKMGLNIAQLARIVETSVKGSVASVYRENGEEYDVYVQLGREFRESGQDLKNIFVKTASGQQIPLSAIAEIRETEAPVSILRKDQNRIVTLSANVSGQDLGSVTDLVEKEIKTIALPSDFRVQISGSAEDMRETSRNFMLAIIVAVLLVYMVMASQFESLLDPFIILFTIPLAMIGVAFSLFLTNTTLNMTSLIGAMVLVGIVVNNGIVLIDYINRLIREEKKHVTDAILEGAQTRLRPVLMTALTTILSMIPLALELGSGAELWGPMARTIIGGLIASTFLTLFFVPVVFDFLQHRRMERKLKESCGDYGIEAVKTNET